MMRMVAPHVGIEEHLSHANRLEFMEPLEPMAP